MGIIQYAQERHKEKANTECVWCCQKKKKKNQDDKEKRKKPLSKTSNLLRLHQTGTALLRAHAQVTEQLLPRLGSAPRVL